MKDKWNDSFAEECKKKLREEAEVLLEISLAPFQSEVAGNERIGFAGGKHRNVRTQSEMVIAGVV